MRARFRCGAEGLPAGCKPWAVTRRASVRSLAESALVGSRSHWRMSPGKKHDGGRCRWWPRRVRLLNSALFLVEKHGG